LTARGPGRTFRGVSSSAQVERRGASPEDRALVALGERLRAEGYRHVTVTPETHRRVNARPGNERAHTLRDVFGWSRPFSPEVLSPGLLALLEASGELLREEPQALALRARRVAHPARGRGVLRP
jgi:hypothetical protein